MSFVDVAALKKLRDINLREQDAVTKRDALPQAATTRQEFWDVWAAKRSLEKILLETAMAREDQNFIARGGNGKDCIVQQPQVVCTPTKSALQESTSHTNTLACSSTSPARSEEDGSTLPNNQDAQCAQESTTSDTRSRKRSASLMSSVQTISISDIENEDAPLVSNNCGADTNNDDDDQDDVNDNANVGDNIDGDNCSNESCDESEDVDKDASSEIEETDSDTVSTLYDSPEDEEIASEDDENATYSGSASDDCEKETENSADDDIDSDSFIVPDSDDLSVYDCESVEEAAAILANVCGSKDTRAERKKRICSMSMAIEQALKGDFRHAKWLIESQFIFNQSRIQFGAHLKGQQKVLRDLALTAFSHPIETEEMEQPATKTCFLCLTKKPCSVDAIFSKEDKRSCGSTCAKALRAILTAYDFLRILVKEYELQTTDATKLIEQWCVISDEFDAVLNAEEAKKMRENDNFSTSDCES